MFDLWCPIIGSAVLRWSSDVVSVANPRRGEIDVLIRCACDDLVLLRPDRRERPPAAGRLTEAVQQHDRRSRAGSVVLELESVHRCASHAFHSRLP